MMAMETSAQDPGSALTQVSSALAAEEANLSAKLSTIREKRRSLRVVIDLFANGSARSNGMLAAVPPQPQPTVDEPQTAADEPQAPPPAPKLPAPSAVTTIPPSKSKWQDYICPEFQEVSFPKAVEFILVEHFDDGADAATIMNELFVDSIPDEARKRGRNRLSNVLAVGLQNQKWYRNKAGAYIISKAAASAG
ncbi:MAG: hypothetical protein VKK04_09100 [Synechococcales bacterium]|nr:hypothetical protein [Synechococcales bacterium]